MGIARSTRFRTSKGSADDTALVEAMHAIKDEFEAYGWQRMQAPLRHRGWIVNHKKIKCLMREYAMHPPCRRRFVATTDSNHHEPVFMDLSREREVDGERAFSGSRVHGIRCANRSSWSAAAAHPSFKPISRCWRSAASAASCAPQTM